MSLIHRINCNETTYTVNAKNVNDDIPSDVVKVMISDDLDQSFYRHIFKSFYGPKLHVFLPESLRDIQPEAFLYCDMITAITIPPRVTKIGCNAFRYCNSLRVVNLCDTLQEIDDYAFMYCPSLEEMVIYSNDEILTECKCPDNASITIPSNVTRIGHAAFAYCFQIQDVQLSQYLQEIDNWAFRGCSNLKEILFPDTCKVSQLGGEAFAFCSCLQSVKLPKSLQMIGNEAFNSCHSLQSIILPSNLSMIEQRAFEGCTQLQSVTFPKSLTQIEEYAFSKCYSLTSINFPDTMNATIKQRAFYRCEHLQSIIVPTNCTIADDAFTYVLHTANYKERIPENVNDILIRGDLDQSLYTNAFNNIQNIRARKTFNVIFSQSFKEIQDGAFSKCCSIKSITIPSGISKVGRKAFRSCTSLTHVYLDDKESQQNRIVIGDEAFRNCSKLHFTEIPVNAPKIGKRVFYNCKFLDNSTRSLKEEVSYNKEGLVPIGRVFCCYKLK